MCIQPSLHSVLGVAFFVVFILIAAMVIMPLFMGAVSLNMCNAMVVIKDKRQTVDEDKHERSARARTLVPGRVDVNAVPLARMAWDAPGTHVAGTVPAHTLAVGGGHEHGARHGV